MSSDAMTATARLDLFFDRTTELFTTRLARSEGLESSFSIKFDQTGSRFSISNPDEEDLRSYLLTYRQFISNNEPIFLDKVHNTLWQEIDAATELQAELAKAQKFWRQQCRHGMMALSIDGQPFPPELLQDLYINGHYFHNDNRKKMTLEALTGLGPLLARHGFLDQIVVGSRYIGFLRSVVGTGRSRGVLRV